MHRADSGTGLRSDGAYDQFAGPELVVGGRSTQPRWLCAHAWKTTPALRRHPFRAQATMHRAGGGTGLRSDGGYDQFAGPELVVGGRSTQSVACKTLHMLGRPPRRYAATPPKEGNLGWLRHRSSPEGNLGWLRHPSDRGELRQTPLPRGPLVSADEVRQLAAHTLALGVFHRVTQPDTQRHRAPLRDI